MTSKDPNWQPYPFSTVWVGHLMTGAITALGIFIALAALFQILAMDIELSMTASVVLIGWLVAETISTVFDQWQSKVHQHHSPGGWVVASSRIIIFLAVYGVTAFMILPTATATILCGAFAGIAALIETMALKSWQPGPDTEDVRNAWRETNRMTREVLSERD